MTTRANGRSALILATGLFVCFAGPSQAAGADADNAATSSKPENAAGAPIALDKYTKHSARHAHRKSSKVALKSSTAKKPATTDAAAEAPAAPAATVMAAASNESSTWDQTSLIGKIFIGFGALLTMASAARMFMA